MGTLPGSRSANPASPQEAAGGRWETPAQRLSFAKCKRALARRSDLQEGLLPAPAPPHAPLSRVERRGRGADERPGAGLGCQRGPAAPGVRQGGTAGCLRTPPATAPTGPRAGKGAEDDGGAMETAGWIQRGPGRPGLPASRRRIRRPGEMWPSVRPARSEAGGGDPSSPPGRGARCEVRRKARAKATRTSGGQRPFVPLLKNGARPWLVLSARRPSQSPSFVFGKMDRSSSDIRRGSTWAPGEDGTPGPVWVGTRRPEARPAAPLGADWRDGEGCRRLTGARPFHSCSGAWRAPAAAPFR
ncbi:unnamed protein product [Rangifer tarandus platyrhynchus]|uniref:Uncharacterized protein n=2 Tax=Rangifer tarandus platyrhynchus TaxID=3082113 RepID=A0ACB0ETH1_RANTA|nr:unnamed protein product [Rangifer tarandus platyrhynchus]CAI9704057.1 unnamed protein product [Rangifer tarandus platyrhynchus]